MQIHPTAAVEEGARIAPGAIVGPYCRVGAAASIEEGVVLQSFVVVEGETAIGPRTVVHPFTVLGGPPQHLGYRGETTRLTIGADNIIREHVTMNRGTVAGRGETRIGSRGFFMAGCHIAHDCVIGDNVIFANNATLGGHVVVEDYAFLGGLCAVHQYCRVGAFSFIGGCAAVPTDVIPYGSAIGNHAKLEGLNIVGMKRRGLSREAIHETRAAYRMLFANGETFRERLGAVETRYGHREEVARILAFVRSDAVRPLMTPGR
jgi:UDP-N-acetylglucosamine acyltransferase